MTHNDRPIRSLVSDKISGAMIGGGAAWAGSGQAANPNQGNAVVIRSSSPSRARHLPRTAFRSTDGVTICNTTVYRHLSPVSCPSITSTAPGMVPRRREAGATCSAAGRVTAQLLLSFLALSASPIAAAGNAGQDAQIVIPIDASPIAPLIPEPPAPAEHTFVSCLVTSCLQEEAANHRRVI
jgi:hypothetical protein